MSVIEETKNQTLKEVDDLFSATDELEWENEKQKILQELIGSFNSDPGISSGLQTSSAIQSRSIMNTSLLSGANTTTSVQNRTIMSEIEMEFSKEIFIYNQKVIYKEQPKPDLLSSFVNLVQIKA